MIKHALSANTKIDFEAAEKKAKEALLAKMKLRQLEKQREASAREVSTPVLSSDPVLPPMSDPVVPGIEEELAEGSEEGEIDEGEIDEGEAQETAPALFQATLQNQTPKGKKNKKSKKERKRLRAEMAAAGGEGATSKSQKKRKHSSITG
jgi:hypothetical protein